MRSRGRAGWIPLLAMTAFAGAARGDARAVWSPSTRSPSAVRTHDLVDREADLLARCGTGEAGLVAAARHVVDAKLRGDAYLDLEAIAFEQRRAGEPHVWPRVWLVSGRALDHESNARKLERWLRSRPLLGERRCGVASGASPDGTEAVAVVAADALADLAPLPTRAHVGEWLTVDARMLVRATSASVVVLGPSGAPWTAPTSLSDGRVRARFAPDRAGAFVVQVVADVETGPRPVLEARVYADVPPPEGEPDEPAPGERAGAGAADATTSLARMIDAMRRAEGLPAIARDAALDAIARAHAREMRAARTLGHDVGDGDPTARIRDAGLEPREAGENVAHSPSPALAHRALYASPSHRANLLRGDFDRVGLAVIEDADGSVWVDELFARF